MGIYFREQRRPRPCTFSFFRFISCPHASHWPWRKGGLCLNLSSLPSRAESLPKPEPVISVLQLCFCFCFCSLGLILARLYSPGLVLDPFSCLRLVLGPSLLSGLHLKNVSALGIWKSYHQGMWIAYQISRAMAAGTLMSRWPWQTSTNSWFRNCHCKSAVAPDNMQDKWVLDIVTNCFSSIYFPCVK